MFHVPNKFRERKNQALKSDDTYGNNGFFIIPHYKITDYFFYVQVSDGAVSEESLDKWEHVSVSIAHKGQPQTRTPTWQEMCYIKGVFWDDEDCVVQYHPAKNEYVNMHQFVLHLWRPVNQAIPTPPKIMVGI
jgi:hypothetical protein